MKKAVLILIVLLVAALVGMPLFAQRHGNYQNAPAAPMHQQGFGGHMGMDGANRGCGMGGHYNGRGMSGNVKVGTVAAVDAKAGIITVTDSDGKAFKVSINPQALICDATEAVSQRNALRANPPAPGALLPARVIPKIIPISDVKTGDWISVSYLNTGTATLDASRVQVIKK